MADAGSIVTNAQVEAFDSGIGTVEGDLKKELLVQAVEQKVLDHLGRDPLIDPGAGNPTVKLISVPPEVTWGGMVQRPVDQVSLGAYPIIAFTSLEIVRTLDSSGQPDQTQTIARDGYRVNIRSGIITLFTLVPEVAISAAIVSGNSLSSFPAGSGVLRATFRAGYAQADVPAPIKLAILAEIARWHSLTKKEWSVEATRTEFGSVELNRVELGKEARGMLRRYKRPILSAATAG